MAENGEEKLLAVARHIAKTLGHNNHNMADDILQIFSNFDGRFSKEKLSDDGAGNDPMGCTVLEQTLNSLESQISRLVSSDHPIWSNSDDSTEFLAAVDELVATIDDWSSLSDDKTVSACLLRADDMLQQAMFRAEEEFRSLMELGGDSFDLSGDPPFDSNDEEEEDNDGLIPVAKPVTNYDLVIDTLPPATVNNLREIAKRMVAADFGKECSRVYIGCRREFLEESLSRLGLQKLSISEVHKIPWQDLEDEIERWTKASKVALKILFPSERRLCDRVFSGLSSSSSSAATDLSFMEVCRGSAIQLLNFADAIAIGSRSPERLFKVLDVFETMRDLIPEFESLFSDQYCSFLVNEAITILKRFGETIRGVFVGLENLISGDPAKALVPGGGLHPITRYVMNYLRAACRSCQTLELVFQDNVPSLKDYPKLDDRFRVQSNASFSAQISCIMDLLERNLEAKSKIYKDPALCSVFMMNNVRYIVQKAKNSELGTLLGDDWIRKHTAKVRQCHVSYQRSSWNKLLGFLKVESNGSMSMVAKPMKEKIKLFNQHFEEICRVQSQWFVFDDQLKEEIRISLEKILLPAYGSFIGRFNCVPELAKNADRYIKYGMEDIEARLNNLFQGSNGSNGGRK